MTTSALRFRGEALHVEDGELRELLKAVAYHLPDHAHDNPATAVWLVEACASWMDTHEDFPPGLRDLELDDVLTTPERLTGLGDYLGWLTRHVPPGHAYDARAVRRVVERIVAQWGAAHCAGVPHDRPARP